MNNSETRIIQAHIASKAILLRMYMPFVNHGALFLPGTCRDIMLGDHVFLVTRLLEDPLRYACICKVVWTVPSPVTAADSNGLGLQLPEADSRLRFAIETLLTSDLESRADSFTF